MNPKSTAHLTLEVKAILKRAEGDPERSHSELDRLMEETLISLGYSGAVRLIRSSTRWYS